MPAQGRKSGPAAGPRDRRRRGEDGVIPRRASPLPEGVITEPSPHVLSRSAKQIHGWWPGKRDCTSERLLVNPYNGCSHDCGFCYAHALPGRFAMFAQHGVVTVCEGFDREVGRQLDSLLVAACGYLSPVTDPFQPVDGNYRLSVSIMGEFVNRGLPVEFVTKGVVPDEALDLLRGRPHCFGQVSIITVDPLLHRVLVPGGASPSQLLGNVSRLHQAGIPAVARLDPVIPYLTDDPDDLREAVRAIRAAGAGHLVVSCLDLPLAAGGRVLDRLSLAIAPAGRAAWRQRIQSLYRERIGNSLHAAQGYRRDLFAYLRGLAVEAGLGFALCMEYAAPAASVGPPAGLTGLNREYTTTRSCEGIDVPLYVRDSLAEPFRPVAGCDGACLWCERDFAGRTCGLPALAGGGAWQLADYRRFGRERAAQHLAPADRLG